MSVNEIASGLSVWAGLLAPPLAWALNLQLGQVLPYLDCTGSLRGSALASAACTIVALIGGLVSLRSARHADGSGEVSVHRFAGALSALTALVFVFALALQMTASMVLTGCER